MRLHSPSWASSDSNSRRRCEVVQAIRTAYSRSVDFARWWVAALLVVVFTSQSATATDYRVNPDAPGPIHDGSSWQYAFKHLNDALNYSQLVSGDRIWVKQAVYSPGTGATDTFSIPSGVGVYGGFLGTEPNFNARPDPPTQTFLSGEDVNNHVIFIATGSDGTVLDGFVIEKGKASNTSGNASRGAGIFIGKTAINLVFKHCVVRECAADGAGGGLFANDDVSFDMAFCVFRNNTTLKRGGGINLGRVGPVNIQCTLFTNNHAVIEGGGLSIINTTIGPEVYSCEFRSNSAYLGGAVYVESLLGGSFGNCTVTENDAFNSTSVPPASGKGGAFYVDLKNSGTMQVFNSIIWGNRSQDANDLWEFGSSIVGHVDPPGDTQDDADLVSVDLLGYRDRSASSSACDAMAWHWQHTRGPKIRLA